MEWEYNDRASSAFPLYSRAVLGDLCPDPVTPLGASAGIGGELGPAWARVYLDNGHPVPEEDRQPVALFGGYLYLNTSLFRLFGVSAGNADPMAFARQYLGERPDVPRQRDERPASESTTERLRAWNAGVLSGSPDLAGQVRAARRVAELRAARPVLASCTDAELAVRIDGVRGELREALRLYAHAELATAVCSDLLTRTTEDAGYPGLTGALVAGLGGSVTEEPLGRLWQLARQVSRSDKLDRLFDQGVATVAARLGSTSDGDVSRLRTALGALRDRYGHHGPAEWEMSAETWGTDARLLLHLLDVLRRAEHEPEPATRARQRADRSAESAAVVRRSMRGTPDAAHHFDAALHASSRWLLARQRIRQVCSMLHHEQRLAAVELGRRHAATGLLDSADQIFMLLSGELRRFVAEPDRFGESLRMRAYDYHALATYQPPFVTIGQPPPVVRWPRGRAARSLVARRGLQGTATSPGTAIGPARVLRSPTEAAGVRPGDVLVVPSGGPGWVPLLPVASAVVMDAGAALSEVAVAARDLGIPCVAATVDATGRIAQGAGVEVDGFAGMVRLTGRPENPAHPTAQSESSADSSTSAGPATRPSGRRAQRPACVSQCGPDPAHG